MQRMRVEDPADLDRLVPPPGTARRLTSGVGTPLAYPPGTRPGSGMVVVEHRRGGTVSLHVARGECPAAGTVRQLFADGQLVFDAPADLARFVNRELVPAFTDPVPVGRASSASPTIPARERSQVGQEVSGLVGADQALPHQAPTAEEIRAGLSDRVVGQAEALSRLSAGVAAHVRKVRPRAPYSALLLGPSGVGKTETSRSLREVLSAGTARPWRHLQVSCGEITGPDQLNRVIGAAPGYVGYADGAPLADAVAGGPAVVVFDEIDKAHPALLNNVLLELLDRGTLPGRRSAGLTDSDARTSVVLFTSNLGADAVARVPRDDRWLREHLRRSGVRPELVGRLADVIAFPSLSEQSLVAAARRALMQVLDQFDLHLVDTDQAAVALISDHDGASGVRGLQVAAETALRAVVVEHLRRHPSCRDVEVRSEGRSLVLQPSRDAPS